MKNILNPFAKKLLLASSLSFGVAAVTGCGPSGNKPNVEIIQDMMIQESLKAQEYDEYFKGGISAQVPPEHTQPVGFTPYKWGMDVNAAIKENKNPMAGDMSPEVLMKGQKFYETNCQVCHGAGGLGDGAIKASYPLPIPSLMSDKIRTMPDAGIFHIITMGQGVMGPYASHVPQQYRWQVVNYIRMLQKNSDKK
jgi:mono/diheme cytochrome c family protein